jgi:hypothetical protein
MKTKCINSDLGEVITKKAVHKKMPMLLAYEGEGKEEDKKRGDRGRRKKKK